MITERLIGPEDYDDLSWSIAGDPYHANTDPDFFYEFGSMCKVHEDERGPIFYVRGTKALRLDIQFANNNDWRRNVKGLTEGFLPLVERARENGFTELIFNSTSDLLRKFCIKRFGFVESDGELRRFI